MMTLKFNILAKRSDDEISGDKKRSNEEWLVQRLENALNDVSETTKATRSINIGVIPIDYFLTIATSSSKEIPFTLNWTVALSLPKKKTKPRA
jgi:hypothetical protein